MSIAIRSNHYFTNVFANFVMEKVCFEYWKIKNDTVEYAGWPEALKMDQFVENALTKTYENELTFLYR